VSKRDDDSQADMEVGMTTAERRRRRRRGGGLRVPSDNVPRRSSTPPVVAPVPEDPALAMSIAYSFTNDASEPVRVDGDGKTVPRRRPESSTPPFEPTAPEAIPTLIDPPSSPVEEASFEMKTREMTAVDLEALGLSDSYTTLPQARISSPKLEAPTPTSNLTVRFAQPREQSVIVEDEPAVSRTDTDPPDLTTAEDAAVEAATTDPQLPVSPSPPPVPENHDMPARRPRLATVALTEEDLEEVMEAARAITNQPAASPPPRPTGSTSSPPPFKPSESLPELDINDLSERADSSSESAEIEIAVDDDNDSRPTAASTSSATPPPPPHTEPNQPRRASVDLAQPERTRPPSVPPPMAPATLSSPASPATLDKNSSPSLQTVAPPPPVPVVHKHPPAPPPKKSAVAAPPIVAASPAAARTETGSKPARGKPWFVDLFDEDYLRTLPFLTPQATQAEAEFAVDAMSLSPGAQVLDVGCGYGRHAMELAARGFHVVGLDLSTPLLVRGGEEAHRRGLTINFIRGDMRELDFDGQFDGAYCLFSTFGYFDDETNKKTAQNIARALKPGGKVLIEILNRDYIIQDLPTRVWWEGEGCVVLEEVELNYFSSRIQVNRSVVFDDGRQVEQEISVRAYSLHEVGKLMHAAGFRVLEVSGGYQTRGRFFGNQSRHIIVLAERRDPSSP